MSIDETKACQNTDKELWRTVEGDYYSKHKLYLTDRDSLMLCQGGTCITLPPEDWFNLANLRFKTDQPAGLSPDEQYRQVRACIEHACISNGKGGWDIDLDSAARGSIAVMLRTTVREVEQLDEIPDDVIREACIEYMRITHPTWNPDHEFIEGAGANWKLYADGIRATFAVFQKLYKPKRESGGWNPIETAPKDGTSILLCNHTFTPDNMAVAFWEGRAWEYCDEDFYHCPSHWMPLPKLPKINGIEGGKS